LLEDLPARVAAQGCNVRHRFDRFLERVTTNPVPPCASTSGTEPFFHAMTGVPQASDSIMTKPKGSGQSWETGGLAAFAPTAVMGQVQLATPASIGGSAS